MTRRIFVKCAVCGKALQRTRYGYAHISRRKVNHVPQPMTEDRP